ncbi:RNA-binding protein [Enterococcus faecalis]|nr:RNA-binding protein [Enterococcus faecalis]
MNKQELIGILEGLEGDSFIEKYNEGYDQAVRDCLIAAKQLDEPKKVAVPKFVASELKKLADEYLTLRDIYTGDVEWLNNGTLYLEGKELELANWVNKNETTFEYAWIHGYEVEKEPTIHELKILPTYFEDVIVGKKTFEIRKNDRDYKVGDILILNEYTCGSLTGRKCKVLVNYITDYKQKESNIVLGIIRFNNPEDGRKSRS